MTEHHQVTCKDIAWNLLTSGSTSKVAHLREILEAGSHCPQFNELNNFYQSALDPLMISRVKNFETSTKDAAYIEHIFLRNQTWNRKKLVAGLPWYSKAYYYTFHQITPVFKI